jgi:hypothetical protein
MRSSVLVMDHQRKEGLDADAVEARDAAVVEAAREVVAVGDEVAPHGLASSV